MDPLVASPYECGGSGLADSARSLERMVRLASAAKSEGIAMLRRHLGGIAQELAEGWLREVTPIESQRLFHYHKALWKLREIVNELEFTPRGNTEPSGVRVVLEAFRDRFLPNAVLALRPTNLATIIVREHLETLFERLAELGIALPESTDGAPGRLLVARYPQGEQHNVLMTCCALPYFHLPRMSHVFATSTAGPAYFFAVAAEIQNNKGFSDAFDPPKLCFIGELLQISGWLEHPQVGPLIQRWQAQFGFGPDYLDRHIKSEATLNAMRATQEEYRAQLPVYTPADFDTDAPAIWDRLRQRLACGTSPSEGSESERPMDAIAVLNAGWSFAQLYLNDLYKTLGSRTAEERYESRQVFNRLLAQSIERSSGAR